MSKKKNPIVTGLLYLAALYFIAVAFLFAFFGGLGDNGSSSTSPYWSILFFALAFGSIYLIYRRYKD
jgi:membrane protein implicated in regulation of membrane protease activity